MKRTYYPPPPITQKHRDMALAQLLTFREDLDFNEHEKEGIARSHGISIEELEKRIQSAQAERTWRDLR